jgi:serine/threonine-protein kinase
MSGPDPRELAEKRVGQTLGGKWRVDRVIDMGGMAAVLAATDPKGAKVAIKILHPHVATNADVRYRFLREGYAANQVDHRGAVRITADGETDDGLVFLVMELLEGESFEAMLDRLPGGRVPLVDLLAISYQTLDTLEAFHARGVIHRDIKPANLFITTSGVVKVLDFGFARLHASRITGAGIVLGTVTYMAPEQVSGDPADVDARTDLYEMGAVMFQALVGKPFIEGSSMIERVMNVKNKPAPKIATRMPELPESVASVVDRALAFEKKDRWESAGDMRDAIWRAHTAMMRAQKKSGETTSDPSAVVRISFPGRR